MAMSLCDKCFENNWKFKKIGNYIRATCQWCAHEVEFKARKPKKPEPQQLTIFTIIEKQIKKRRQCG